MHVLAACARKHVEWGRGKGMYTSGWEHLVWGTGTHLHTCTPLSMKTPDFRTGVSKNRMVLLWYRFFILFLLVGGKVCTLLPADATHDRCQHGVYICYMWDHHEIAGGWE